MWVGTSWCGQSQKSNYVVHYLPELRAHIITGFVHWTETDLKFLNNWTNYTFGAGMNRNTHLSYNCTFLLCVSMSLSLSCTLHSSCLLSLKRAFRDIKTQCSSEKQQSSCPYWNSFPGSSKSSPTGCKEGLGEESLAIWASGLHFWIFSSCQVKYGHRRKSPPLTEENKANKNVSRK